MGSSPDVGGSRGMGRPQIMEYQEQAQTAQVANLKAGMGMVQSTLEIPLHQLGAGELPYQYQAHSAKPNLDTKVLVQMERPDLPEEDPAEEAAYQETLDKLPLQLSLQLQNDRKKPEHERNPKLIVLELILRFVAKALVWLESVSEIDSSQHSENIAKVEAFPHATLRGWIDVAGRICHTIKTSPAPSFMTPQGVRDVKTNFSIMKRMIALAKSWQDAKEDDRDKALKKIEKELALLQRQVATRKIQGLFRITESLLSELILIMGSLKNKTGACSLTTFVISSSSFNSGKTLMEILTALAETPEEFDLFQKQFLPPMMALIIAGFPLLAIAASGKRNLKAKKDERLEKETIQSLAMSLACCLIVHSEVLAYAADAIFGYLEISEEKRETLITATEVIAINSLVLAADSGKKEVKSPQPLLNGVKKGLVSKLEKLKEIVKEQKTTELFRELNTGIRQGGIALKRKESSGGYFEAIKRCLTPMKLKYPDLREDCEKVTEVAASLLSGIHDTRQQVDYSKIVVQAA